MPPEEEDHLLELAGAVSDAGEVDWDREDRAAGNAEERSAVRALRALSRLVTAHRTLQEPDAGSASEEPAAAPPHAPDRSAEESAAEGLEPWGPLVLLEEIGRGAFGEVYRARDSRLQMEVALKLLAPDRHETADLENAVLSEGRMLARIRHPNVVQVHGAERHEGRVGLWMDFVRGRTLARMVREHGPFSAREAALVGVDLCRALAAIHGAGLVHRDVKAQNIMREDGGRIVLMDLGAGSWLEGEAGAGQEELRGTPLYMAPEVLRGERATPRSDLYGLGVLLYYLVTGSYPIAATSVDSLRRAQERGEEQLLRDARSDLPDGFVQVVERSLAPDPGNRFASAGEMERSLRSALESTAPSLAPATRRNALVGILATSIVVAAAMVVWALVAPSSFERIFLGAGRHAPDLLPRSGVRFVVDRPLARWGPAGLDLPAVALSPEGSNLVYVAERDGTSQLYLRALDQLESVPIPGTEGAAGPFFSPDGKWIGFFAGDQLKKVSAGGGALAVLADALLPRGATWSPDGSILFSPVPESGLLRLPASGGTPEVLTTPDASRGERSHRWPSLLPGGRAILFTVGGSGISSFDDARIVALSLDTGERRIVVEGGSFPLYSPAGQLLFVRGGALLAAPFDPERLEVTAPASPVLEGVMTHPFSGSAHIATSNNGVLAYLPGAPQTPRRGLRWVDRTGAARPLTETEDAFLDVRVSPDGKHLALDIDAANASVWTYEIGRDTRTRLTLQWNNISPIWTPDGRRVTFGSDRDSLHTNIYWKAASATEQAQRLTESEHTQWPTSWSPDGRVLAFTEVHPVTGLDIWLLQPDSDPAPRQYLRTPFNESQATFSPDGRWIAYASDESGRNEIYVQSYPGPGDKLRVSTRGGLQPVWSRRTDELFYCEGNRLMTVAVGTRPRLSASRPRVLFEVQSLWRPWPVYDAAPGGDGFVVIASSDESGQVPVHVVYAGTLISS